MSEIPPYIALAKIISLEVNLSSQSKTLSSNPGSSKVNPSRFSFNLNLYIVPVLKSPTNTESLYFSNLGEVGNSIAVTATGISQENSGSLYSKSSKFMRDGFCNSLGIASSK